MSTERSIPGPDLCETLDLPADLILGCVETGGQVRCEEDHLEFVPGTGERVLIDFTEISQMRLGGRDHSDANRLDLFLLDGRKLTFLLLGRERVVELILKHSRWEEAQSSRDSPNGENHNRGHDNREHRDAA